MALAILAAVAQQGCSYDECDPVMAYDFSAPNITADVVRWTITMDDTVYEVVCGPGLNDHHGAAVGKCYPPPRGYRLPAWHLEFVKVLTIRAEGGGRSASLSRTVKRQRLRGARANCQGIVRCELDPEP